VLRCTSVNKNARPVRSKTGRIALTELGVRARAAPVLPSIKVIPSESPRND
jgi:hypothetical protein